MISPRKNGGPMFVYQTIDPATARLVVHQACTSCRAKKVRCTREKTGCRRCRTLSRPCVYDPPGPKASGHKRKQGSQDSGTASSKTKDKAQTGAPAQDLPPSNSEGTNIIATEPSFPDVLRTEGELRSCFHDLGDQIPMSSSMSLALKFNNDVLGRGPVSGAGDDNGSAPPLGGQEGGHHKEDKLQALFEQPDQSEPHLLSETDLLFLGSDHSGASKDAASAPVSATGTPSPRACQCLQNVVLLIEELESEGNTVSTRTIDTWLASLKESLRCVEAMLRCASCGDRPENMTILTFLTDRIMSSCERHIDAYLDSAGPGSRSTGGIQNRRSSHHSSAVYFGEYMVESPYETEIIVRNLIVWQLRTFNARINDMKDVSATVNMDSLFRKVTSTKRRIATLQLHRARVTTQH
ncbi:hypothetical protein M406DRAFT_335085 [Cryphonectria parasitica EP155]|uniref:Zn(2)-C6 fungal-type domain-containing protein n=1 Tax=Cryphonectria parasitica (strain ATCC 38755 / EP155) TaxID=660469 RepID=A0A9P4XSC3_CRYP1|nr:uncharacterized protein M406DRAFT_335085 [Cryphonectria parasitica EP155]KAF3760419.1 hypothetical protein M406DRAFT_335085 [Cryphonectria parasitica EP155]